MKILLIIISLFISISCLSQSFTDKVDSLYNFRPNEMTEEEKGKVFPSLDEFFEMVIADTTTYLPLIRKELISDNHLPYFYYDAGHLLMMNSNNKSDLDLVVSSFVKCDIMDLSPKVYVSLLMDLAKKGINTTSAAVKILSDSTFSFFIPQHAMTFNQGYSLLYCLTPLKPKLYTDTLISLFKETKSITTQKSIITNLWFSYSCNGDEFLKSLTRKNTLSNKVLKYSEELLESSISDDFFADMDDKDFEILIESVNSGEILIFSDEAIYYYDMIVKLKRKNKNCR